jgi:hypothetical protein
MDEKPAAQERFEETIRRFDRANAEDPNLETSGGQTFPREWLYARRLTEWVLKLSPEASEALLLAARCQHLCRWMIPREKYQMNRPGYLRWRQELKQFHAQKAGEILSQTGYPPEMIECVQALVLKKHFPHDPESQVLEDALCLVFLEHQFAALAAKTSEDKVINALKKSWGKMSSKARSLALELPYAPREKELLQRALGSS